MQWSKERKFTNNLEKWRSRAGNSWVERLSFWPTRGQIQNRVTVKLNVCVMPPNSWHPAVHRSRNEVTTKFSLLSIIASVSRPFHNCVRSCLASEWKWGWRWTFFIGTFQHLCQWCCCSHARNKVYISVRIVWIAFEFQFHGSFWSNLEKKKKLSHWESILSIL